MTEIKRDLSVNGLNFNGSKNVRKPETEQEPIKNSETDVKSTDLNEAPGAIYGRLAVKKTADVSETKKCVEQTAEDFKQNPDIHVLADMVFKNALDEAKERGCSDAESYIIATEIAHAYLAGNNKTEEYD